MRYPGCEIGDLNTWVLDGDPDRGVVVAVVDDPASPEHRLSRRAC
ncbi:hypothetical protein [Microbacterium aurantiacum]|nr:hypothetical protein [Microbacterium aurantiacum]